MDCIHIDGGHAPPGWATGSDTLDKVRQATGWVKTLAARYKADPTVAAYDLINEPPRTSSQMNSILDVYNVLINAVRSIDPEKILMLNAPWGNNSPTPGDLGRITNRHNLVWTFHDYFAGGDDDGYSSSGGQAGTWVWDGKTGYPNPNPTQLENYIKVQVNWAAKWGVPSWVGEFGIGNNAQNRDRWITDQVTLFNKYGLGYNWWEFNAHGGWPFGATDSSYRWFPFVDLLFR
jgi:hypothetical protein